MASFSDGQTNLHPEGASEELRFAAEQAMDIAYPSLREDIQEIAGPAIEAINALVMEVARGSARAGLSKDVAKQLCHTAAGSACVTIMANILAQESDIASLSSWLQNIHHNLDEATAIAYADSLKQSAEAAS